MIKYRNPRSNAVEILNMVERDHFYAEPLINKVFLKVRYEKTEDKRLLNELVYGTLRLKNRLDFIITYFYSGNFQKMEDGIRNILRVALYQMFCMDKIPGYAAVNEAVQFTKSMYPGREGLVNAILRNSARRKKEIVYPGYCQNPVEFIASFHSH
ncbi:MAG: transcription antitermination factor NusB, partial [Syntrophales bacterium]|nr:transcription antitermination factor NusB [Syntrophales bacterium]